MHVWLEEVQQPDQVRRSRRLQVKRFSTKPSFKSIWPILSKWVPAPEKGSAQVPIELDLP